MVTTITAITKETRVVLLEAAVLYFSSVPTGSMVCLVALVEVKLTLSKESANHNLSLPRDLQIS